MPTKQAISQQKKRLARGLQTRGRKPWTCPACGSRTRWQDATRARHCTTCHPSPGRGRPKKSTT